MDENVIKVGQALSENLRAGVEGTHAEIPKVELAYTLAYISELEQKLATIRENNPFLIGDRVRLDPDPNNPDAAPKGVIVGFGNGKSAIVASGEFKSLWFTFDELERIER